MTDQIGRLLTDHQLALLNLYLLGVVKVTLIAIVLMGLEALLQLVICMYMIHHQKIQLQVQQ